VAAKTTSNPYETVPFPPDPNSNKSTIATVEREIKEAGGTAFAIQVDVRDVSQVENMVKETVRLAGRLDVLVYNSGAIWWSSVENTPTKRFQLMQRVNPEGLYATVQAALPEFEKNGWKGRIVVVSPPIYSRFFRGKTAYAMGKSPEFRSTLLLAPRDDARLMCIRQGCNERSYPRSRNGLR
jgi:NAD(P)-dependent dehydrogenase (short-subunit alcohol dehydrogenase family)